LSCLKHRFSLLSLFFLFYLAFVLGRVGIPSISICNILLLCLLTLEIHLFLEPFLVRIGARPTISEGKEAAHGRVKETLEDAVTNLTILDDAKQEADEGVVRLFIFNGRDCSIYE